MIKKIVEGYEKLFNSVGKIFLLLLFCAALGVAFVYPLWKFATVSPKIYTIVIFSIFLITILFFCLKKIKDSGIKNFMLSFAKIITILAGISLCIYLVSIGKRFLAIPSLVLIIVIYGIISFGFKKKDA